MRLDSIRETKRNICTGLQALKPGDISDKAALDFELKLREPIKRKMLRRFAASLLHWQQGSLNQMLGFDLKVSNALICLEERFANDASLAALLHSAKSHPIRDVLIPGCYMGLEDVQFWLRRGVKQLDGIDIYSLEKSWSSIVPQLSKAFQAAVNFQQGSIEEIPFESNRYDLVATNAVLEHVRNLEQMVEETARVLRSGALAWHCFGPLYYSFGGDHCMAAYGDEAGYDHLLLSEDEYKSKIGDISFFKRQTDPNLPFWAVNNQFSFATMAEYLELFARLFHIEHIVLKITGKGLQYRRTFPERWQTLVNAGIPERDLLVKSVAIVLRKK